MTTKTQKQASWSSTTSSSKTGQNSHWSQKVIEASILAHQDGSLGLTIKGGADFGEFPYLGELKQDRIRYHHGKLHQDDIILDVQGQKVAGFTQKDVVLWLKHCSKNETPVLLKCVRAGHLTPDLKQYLAGGFPKGSLDHELQNTIRDNLYMRTVPCTTRPPREGERNGQDYWFMSQDEFMQLEKDGHLLESGLYTGNYYGTPKPPHEPLEKKSEPISDIIRPGGHPSSEGKRRRNRSNVEALSPGASTESTEDLLTVLAAQQHGQQPDRSETTNGNHEEPSSSEVDSHRFVAPQMKEDGGLWRNIASEAVSKVRHHDSGHQSEDEHGQRHEDDLPYGWEKVDDPQYGTYYIDHVNRRTQYDHPNPPRTEVQPTAGGYNSSTFPRIKKKPGSPDTRVPKSASSNLPLNGHQKSGRQILRAESLQGEIMDVTLIKSNRGLGFTVIGGENPQKYPDADFDDDDQEIGAGTLLQLKSIAPGGPADLDGRLRSGDALVNISDRNVLGFTHDQVIELFQKIHPGEVVRMRVCRGYPLPADATDPRAQIITTDAVSAVGSGNTGSLGRSRPRLADSQRPSTTDTRTTSMDTNDQEVAAAFAEHPQVASGPMYKLQIAKGASGFGFTIAEGADGQTIKKIVDKKRCQGLLEGDLLVEINNRLVRGMNHSAVVEVLKEAPVDHPSTFLVQRAQRIEGRKEQRSSRILGRSKTPTADMYKSHNSMDTSTTTKKQRSKTPTPRPTSTLFGFLRSKTPKPGKENVQESVSVASVSNNVYEKTYETRSNGQTLPKNSRARTPEKATSPVTVNQNHDADFKRNQFAYSSMTRMVTPSYIPASQYTKKNEEKARSPPPQERNEPAVSQVNRGDPGLSQMNRMEPVMSRESVAFVPPQREWNQYAPEPQKQYAPEPQRRVESAQPVRVNGIDRRPAQLRVNGGGAFENGSVSSSVVDGDNESQLHSPPGYIDLVVTLRKEDTGFGFRIVGGTEENTQVAVGHVVPGGAAEKDGRLEVGDEIVNIDGVSVMNAEHRQVIQMMQKSSNNGYVVLGVRRRINYAPVALARQITIHRHPNEGFGFVIISSIARNQHIGGAQRENNGSGGVINYPVLGRILENSPAENCGELHVGDKILAVNGIDVLHLHHSDIVQMIKESGTSVVLTVMSQSAGIPDDASTVSANSQHRLDEFAQREAEGAFAPYPQVSLSTSTKVDYMLIELERGTRGFGFSIRGGKEFHNMPLFVLRIAEPGPAADDGRLRVGDEIVEINGVNTRDFTHGQAIDLIKGGGQFVRLLIKRSGPDGMVSPSHAYMQSPNSQSTYDSSPRQFSSDSHNGNMSSFGSYNPEPATFATYGSNTNNGSSAAVYGTVTNSRQNQNYASYPQTHLYSTGAAFQARPYYFGSSGK